MSVRPCFNPLAAFGAIAGCRSRRDELSAARVCEHAAIDRYGPLSWPHQRRRSFPSRGERKIRPRRQKRQRRQSLTPTNPHRLPPRQSRARRPRRRPLGSRSRSGRDGAAAQTRRDRTRPRASSHRASPSARDSAATSASHRCRRRRHASVRQRPRNRGQAPGALPKPPGQTITTVSGERIKNEPAFTIQDLLQESPGVSFKQGNGPRDLGISIRGSNARNGFGIRNIVVLEDGFPVTQPDGLSRTDLTDPHAYGGVDVYRGPSSAMFGNYATGGAINFRLWRGGQINGARYGSRGRQLRLPEQLRHRRRPQRQASKARPSPATCAATAISATARSTPRPLNALGTYAATPNDRFTVKVHRQPPRDESVRCGFRLISSRPTRSSVAAPTPPTAAPGCATVNLFANGFSAPDRAANRRAGRLWPPRLSRRSWARAGSTTSTTRPRGGRKPSSTTRTSTSRPERPAPSATAPRTT